MSTKKLIEAEINSIVESIGPLDPSSDEYKKTLDSLAALERIKHQQHWWSNFDTGALIGAGANILGIVLILNHERLNVVSSKAMNLLHKPKI